MNKELLKYEIDSNDTTDCRDHMSVDPINK